MAPEHGGRLRAAARQWGLPAEQWLDLSTGINPRPWPRPPIPDAVWQRLPEDDDGLEQELREALALPAAAACVPVPGTQAAVQCLPRLPAMNSGANGGANGGASVVAVPAPGYAEHGHCWRQAGHRVLALSVQAMEAQLDSLDVVVWIQPNNPTGQCLAPETLERWRTALASRGGWLLVDEAFVEPEPRWSMLPALGRPGLVVLRSLGKFFGLAGARGGLVLGPAALCGEVRQLLGPWAVAGPTRWLMARALADSTWQAGMREQLAADSRRLAAMLAGAGLSPAGMTGLFCYCPHPGAAAHRDALARQGILVRYFEQPAALRIGLPGPETQWRRLQAGLKALKTP